MSPVICWLLLLLLTDSFPADVFSTSIVMWEVMTNQPRKVINPLACADMEELLNRLPLLVVTSDTHSSLIDAFFFRIRSDIRPSFDVSYENYGLTSQQRYAYYLLHSVHCSVILWTNEFTSFSVLSVNLHAYSHVLQNIHTTIQSCWGTDPNNRLDSDTLHSRCSLHMRDLEHALLL